MTEDSLVTVTRLNFYGEADTAERAMRVVTAEVIAEIYQRESRRVLATLIRLLRDFDLAEEALHEAFTAAAETWPRDGLPAQPRAWLVSTGRFKAIDGIRRRGRLNELQEELVRRQDELQATNATRADEDIEDDRLRLIFTCCHPAIDPQVQVALTLREVCGLTTDEVARAFLIAPTTMAQRIVRGKAKIRDAGIPYVVPSANDLAERMQSVLSVIYLVFNEGYSASSGDSLTRADLSSEAIRLGRLLVELLPDPEALGLLALMLLQESRRSARTTPDGDLVLLEDQDRSRWDQASITEGLTLVDRAVATRRFGSYGIQAAIAAVHARARTAEETDWPQMVGLYDALLTLQPSPIVELNRAVAVAMRDGPPAGLKIVDELLQRGELTGFHLFHAARADLLRRHGDHPAAKLAYEQALALAKQEPERRFLTKRLHEVTDAIAR